MRLQALWTRLTSLLNSRQSDSELEQEIATHLELAADELKSRGISDKEAQRLARVRLGSIPQIREDYRNQRGWPLVESIAADLRFALRQLRRTPGFSTIAILSLALGIGVTTAIYSLIDSILLRPLPFPQQENLVQISGYYPKGWVRAVQNQSRSLASLLSYSPSLEHNILTNSGPNRVFAATITTNAFDVLGLHPQLGRTFHSNESEAGQDHVVILSNAWWQQDFAANPQVIGQTLSVDGQPHTIIGIMPAGISFPDAATRFWLPVSFKPGDPIDPWAIFSGQMIGRLRPGVTPAQAQAELRTLHPQLLRLFPWPMPDSWYADVTAKPLLESIVNNARPKLFLLLSAVALILLITCANVANLMLARAQTRTHEVAVRGALGASPRRLMRQMFTESLTLGLLSGGLALLVALAGLRILTLLLPADTPRLAGASLSPASLFLIAALSIVTSLLFGLAPAMRLRPLKLQHALRTSQANQSPSRQQFRLSSLLVVGQVALSVIVIVGAGLLLHSLWRLLHVDTGFETSNIVTARIPLDPAACADQDAARKCSAFFTTLLERAQALPGVHQAALVSNLPMTGFDQGFAYDLEDHPRSPQQSPDQGSSRTVSPAYFHLLGISLLRGRLLDLADQSGTSHAVVINKEMADHYWPAQNPIGKHLEWVGLEARQGVLDANAFTVVGVVGNTRHEAFDQAPGNEMYVPMAPTLLTPEMSLLLNSSATPQSQSIAIRNLVHSLNPTVPVLDIQALNEVVNLSAKSQRSLTILLLAFAALAVSVGTIGVYSLITCMVNSRTRELGIRLALGATRAQIISLVLRQGLILATAGCLLGLTIAALSSHLLNSFLFATSPLDPLAFAAVPVLLLLLALIAAWQPARKAASIQPMDSLRAD